MKLLIMTFLVVLLMFCAKYNEAAKINTRVLLPSLEDFYVNFTFEIHEGSCYSWSLSRDDIIDLEPIYEDTWSQCSRAARVSVSKSCASPGSVIILAEEANTGEILRGDVDVDKISVLKVVSTTWKLYLDEAPEAFEIVAFDDQGNKFSTLEGIPFEWTLENLGDNVDQDPLVSFVPWSNTDYEAPKDVLDLESQGLRSYTVLLYGRTMGESRVTVCLGDICTYFDLKVAASVLLTPATAHIALGDTLHYRVIKMQAGRLSVQNVKDTLYSIKIPDTETAHLEDKISLVRGTQLGTTNVLLMSGITQVATASLTVTKPHSIKVTLRPPNLLVRDTDFVIHCTVLDKEGHVMTSGEEISINIEVKGDANVNILGSTVNGTITDAIAHSTGTFTVTATLHSIAGKSLWTTVEGHTSGVVIDPLEVIPPELFVAWTDSIQKVVLNHHGGGDEPVTWSERETATQNAISLARDGVLTVRDVGHADVTVQLVNYPYVRAEGRVWSMVPELLQVSSTGFARVNRPHYLHIALTATHPDTGEFYNFHKCDCASFSVSLLVGPEPQNVTAAPWVDPMEGACCVMQTAWASRGVCTLRVARGRTSADARVLVRAAPSFVWPHNAAALVTATLPVLAEGEALVPHAGESRVGELTPRSGSPPYSRPQVQLFTCSCKTKGEARLQLTSHAEEESESVELQVACAHHVSRVRLEPPETPGNCSGGPGIWLRPNQEVKLKVTLLDAIGRELLDERGPKMSWEVEPKHKGIRFTATDRLFVDTHPDFLPVPVPFEYYQIITADEQSIGWNGALKTTIPDATASIHARVVAPLKCDPLKVSIAWEGDSINDIATITGGSGRYSVETPKGVTASVDNGALNAVVPGPGTYDLLITDQCVHGEKQIIEVDVEEIGHVEVVTSRAVAVGACVPAAALVRGASGRRVASSREPQWRASGLVAVRDGSLCGLAEGAGRVRAAYGGVWSADFEVIVFPPLSVVPSVARLPPGARLQLRAHGGPPAHLAALHYRAVQPNNFIEVSTSGAVHGIAVGKARIRLEARDIADVEMASAESEVEVIPVSGVRVRAATTTLLVGAAAGLWLEAGALSASALAALQPSPRALWSLRDPSTARLYTTHLDDQLERTSAEGLTVRVVPLKPGVITIDVRVRNMGQVAETKSLDSTIEIFGISDIRASVEGLQKNLASGERLSLAVGATLRLKSLPKSNWNAFVDGAFELSANGEIKALSPGHGVIVAHHKDDRNNIYRETVVHVEVASPAYCTVEAGDGADGSLRGVLRSALGRPLLAPHANLTADPPAVAHANRPVDSLYGTELVLSGLEAAGAFVSFAASAGGVIVKDHVWVAALDSMPQTVYAAGGWGVCLDGVGWRASADVDVYAGHGVSLALLVTDTPARHTLKLDKYNTHHIQQVPIEKIEFVPGEWPYSMVPLTIEGSGVTNGPIVCSEEQRYALEGVLVQMPFICRTKKPHLAEPYLDINKGEIGCSITPSTAIAEATEVELCAEWGVSRSCTKVYLLPAISTSHKKVSLLKPPTTFSIFGHPHAMKMVKVTPSPGLKLEYRHKEGETIVTVHSETSACGIGWVNVKSKLTSQELRVEVERECEVACGTLLDVIFSLLKPYWQTLLAIAGVSFALLYARFPLPGQSRWNHKSPIRLPTSPPQTVLPDHQNLTPRTRTYSRSLYATNGPVYGDTSVLPDSSISPNSHRMGSVFL